MGQAKEIYTLWQEELDELLTNYYGHYPEFLEDDQELYIELFEEGLTPNQAFKQLDLQQTDQEFYLEHHRL
ncbi:hypothetical protein [Geminocystis sp. NIES-3708]|uniref:hypothetical protein n=1 Tax=Geminocystis sp. NIES-3708 TaxID=1615909 RepID=UPI000830C2C2|nr:hypothetical protein [Geminocystis sp. NIES-3708]